MKSGTTKNKKKDEEEYVEGKPMNRSTGSFIFIQHLLSEFCNSKNIICWKLNLTGKMREKVYFMKNNLVLPLFAFAFC